MDTEEYDISWLVKYNIVCNKIIAMRDSNGTRTN